jgi:glucose-1-phosphate thymidylyltransferase
LINLLQQSVKTVEATGSAVIYGYHVQNPESYGVIEFNKDGDVVSVEEKPEEPKSNYAAIGLYFYPNDVVSISKNIKPSNRGELEITSINQVYLNNNRLKVERMGRGYAWLDTGTFDSLLEAGTFVEVVEKRQGMKIACIEEIAWRQGFISKDKLVQLGELLSKSEYGKYLLRIAHEE